ncbi:MAG TPA: UDP-N-acetylmuramate dehydrogenase [Nitrolancea sp.]|nr:UDP-N-acetylmuramate dehydrogenase [Nitrolancea sp.]
MPETIALATPAGTLKLRRGQPLSLHTTFRIGGPADVLVRVANAGEALAALEWADREGLPVTAIGGGSNLLVGDGGVRGLVLLVRAPGKDVAGSYTVEELGDHVRLTVPAQAPISWLGHLSARHGWQGMDWAAGLPGQVGGAVVNNAGAHGGETKDHLESIDVLDLARGAVERWPRARLEPAYRHTVLKAAPRPRRWLVLGATFLLPHGDAAELTARAEEHARWRRQAQPTGACAGSVFTNPEGTYAGYLIDQAGLKGRQVGGVKVSELHGNFLVNTGSGTAAEVRELIAQIQAEVRRQFGIALVPEIEQIGDE